MENSMVVTEVNFSAIISRLDKVFSMISNAELDAAKRCEEQDKKILAEFKEEALIFASFLSDLSAGRVAFSGVVLKMIALIESFCVLIEESNHE
ncbi:MAG: hypothetical protein Q7K26_01745 [bacterium]|nr:hypothetical protein [bacterium]